FVPPDRGSVPPVVHVTANKGELEIQADDEDLQVTISQGGKKVVQVIGRNSKKLFELPTAAGEIFAVALPGEVRGKTTPFALAPGGRQTFAARVLLADKVPPAAEKPPPAVEVGSVTYKNEFPRPVEVVPLGSKQPASGTASEPAGSFRLD